MQIYIPEHGVSKHVWDFLGSELDRLQQVEAMDKIQGYERFTHLELLRNGKLENLHHGLYKLEVRIDNLRLRFFGKLCSDNLVLVHAFKKKTPRLPSKEIETARRRILQVDCQTISH